MARRQSRRLISSRLFSLLPRPPRSVTTVSTDYETRRYLSVGEVATLTGLSVPHIHSLVRNNHLPAPRSTSGQYRFDLQTVKPLGVQHIGEDDALASGTGAQLLPLTRSPSVVLCA